MVTVLVKLAAVELLFGLHATIFNISGVSFDEIGHLILFD